MTLNGLQQVLSATRPGIERLKGWIKAGGTAIGIGGGAEFLADVDSAITRTRLRRQALDRFPPVVWGPGADLAARGGPFRAAGVRAPEPVAKETESRRPRRAEQPSATPRSPYDVAPVIGPGARPFTRGVELGTRPRSGLTAQLLCFRQRGH